MKKRECVFRARWPGDWEDGAVVTAAAKNTHSSLKHAIPSLTCSECDGVSMRPVKDWRRKYHGWVEREGRAAVCDVQLSPERGASTTACQALGNEGGALRQRSAGGTWGCEKRDRYRHLEIPVDVCELPASAHECCEIAAHR